MSKLRVSKRESMEASFLEIAKQRSDIASRPDEFVAKTLKKLDEDLLYLQKSIDGVEMPRLMEGGKELGDREDELDKIKETDQVSISDWMASGEAEDDLETRRLNIDWQGRCLRITAMVIGVLRGIKRPEEKTPKLAAHVALLALGVDCESMHQAAAAYGLSVERVRQRAEEVRVRFNLPKNQHNKSEMAVQSYKTTARLFNKGAA